MVHASIVGHRIQHQDQFYNLSRKRLLKLCNSNFDIKCRRYLFSNLQLDEMDELNSFLQFVRFIEFKVAF